MPHSAVAAARPSEDRSGAPLEVDVGVAVPVAFSGLRLLLSELEAKYPDIVRPRALAHPAEWNRLFPGALGGAPDLMDLALTPSERRLHRESEQTFWVLNLAARVILDVVEARRAPLKISAIGETDLPTVRAVMRAVEWGRLSGVESLIQTTGWDLQPKRTADIFGRRRRDYLEVAAQRMRAPLTAAAGTGAERPLIAAVDDEGRYLAATLDAKNAAEHRIAAAILTVRACFFSTNYEGAMLAIETALGLLNAGGVVASRVLDAWDALDTKFTTPAIEIDRASVGDVEELKALFYRCLGVLHAFTGSHEGSMEAFAAGLACGIPSEGRAHLRMFRGLLLIKRLGELPNARHEVESGLAELNGRTGQTPTLHEGWLRNVYALTYFQEKKLDEALKQEKLAMQCVGDLHDASATHLKINLISNVSVVQESARRFDDAIVTWRRFEKISANWGDNFSKHHRYRLAGLTLRSGDSVEATRWYRDAYDAASKLGDALHRQIIAAELGMGALEAGDAALAEDWYQKALDHGAVIGDPLALAQAHAGLELSRRAKGGPSGDFAEALRCAALSTTYPAEAKKLADAVATGDGAAIRAQLPKPRTKLNRPFDLVNLT